MRRSVRCVLCGSVGVTILAASCEKFITCVRRACLGV